MLGALAPETHALAQTAPTRSEKPILTVGGRISHPNSADGRAIYRRSDLEALGLSSFTTSSPWYDSAVTFEGVRMNTLMDAVGANGTNVKARALNDYVINIPISDFAEFGVLLAMKRDGIVMGPREKGPLFIIYPYDTNRRLQSDVYYGRSAWQVASLEVE